MHMDKVQPKADGVVPVWQQTDFFLSDFAYTRKIAKQVFDSYPDNGFRIEMEERKALLMDICIESNAAMFRQYFWELLR